MQEFYCITIKTHIKEPRYFQASLNMFLNVMFLYASFYLYCKKLLTEFLIMIQLIKDNLLNIHKMNYSEACTSLVLTHS